MMPLYILLIGVVSLLLMTGCFDARSLDVYPPDNYKGEGEITFIATSDARYAPGWLISFEDFSLSDEYNYTYEFSGLPGVENQKSFIPFLHVPSSVDFEAFNRASLKMSLYEDNELKSTYESQIKDWYCTGPYAVQNYSRDDKNYYCVDVFIPADSSAVYKLEVEYKPSEPMKTNAKGNIFLIMPGGK